MKLRPFYLIPPADWLLTSNPDVAAAKRRAEEQPESDQFQIEEYVRQWVLKELLTTYSYPLEWLGERLIVEESVQMATMVKQADISIKNQRHKTFLYIETKRSGLSQTDFNAAEAQLMSYLASTHTATIGLVTDGVTTRCLVKKIDPNDFDYIPDIPGYAQGEIGQRTKLIRDLTDEMKAVGRKTGLAPLTSGLEDILFRAHSVIRDIDGLHSDEALDELSKIIYTKIYDERQTSDSATGTAFRFQLYGSGNTEEVASNIRDLYKEANDRDLAVYAQRIPGYERSRGVFRLQIRLSSNALVKVVEILQNYSIIDTDGDIKGRAFQQVLGPAIRAGMGQYFTPDEVVNLAVGMLRPTIDQTILDPFCGSGHFLTKCLEHVGINNADSSGYAWHQFKFFHLHGIEKSERMVRIAMCDMALHDDGHSNVRCTDALLSFDNYPDIKALGGDDNADPQVFDVVVTNPPFGSLLGAEVSNIIGRFELGRGRRSIPLEVLGLERSLQFLKPGGRLAIVLQDGIFTGSGHAAVRTWIHSQGEVVALVSLPDHTFTPYGASPKTSVLFLRKYLVGEKPNDGSQTFFGRIDDLGYDATGRPKGKSEVSEMVEAFHAQRGW